jgi:hypothetical protein
VQKKRKKLEGKQQKKLLRLNNSIGQNIFLCLGVMSTRVDNNKISVSYLYDAITNNLVWRHTMGRVSNCVRAPLYLAAGLGQLAKVVIKLPVCAVTFCFINDPENSFSIAAIDRDGGKISDFFEEIGPSIKDTFRGPKRDYISLGHCITDIFKTIFMGQYHNDFIIPRRRARTKRLGREEAKGA